MKRTLRAIALLTLMAAPLALQAASRDLLVHQGFISDASGNPISGQFSVTFRLYGSASGGQALWEETTSVTADNGIFNAELGGNTPFPADLFAQENLYLGVQFAGDQEMTPRLGLYGMPWAQQAEVAVTALSLANDAVTSQNIAPDSIDASDIAPGSIGADELTATGVAAGTYSVASITVDEDGRVIAASNGSAGGTGDITGILAGAGLTGGGASGEVTLSSILGDAIDSSEITDGTVTLADLSASVVFADERVDDDLTISGGAIDATVIGAAEPADGTFTNLSSGESRLTELEVNGSDYVGFKAPDSVDASRIWTLPPADGDAGQALTTDGAGNLSWATPAGGDITGVIAGSGLTGGGTAGSVTLSVDGSSITGINAGNIASGTLDDARLPAGVSRLGSSIEAGEIANGAVGDAQIGTGANIAWNKISKAGANPADVGAAPAAHGHTAAEVGAAPLAHSHAAGDITGSFNDSQVSNSLTLEGSTINNTVIGSNAPQAGTFTELTGTQSLFLEDPQAGLNRVRLQAPDNLAAPYSLRLPANDGNAGQVLATDGDGDLSFVDAASGDVTGITAGSGLTGGGTSGEVSLSVDGPGLTGLNASNLASGTVDDARLSSNVSLLGAAIDSAEVADGSLTDADISSSAGIAFSKLSGVAAAGHGHTAGEVGAAPLLHSHSALDIDSGEFTDAQIDDVLTVGPGSLVDASALPFETSYFGVSVDSSEVADGSLMASDLNANAGLTDAQISDALTVSGGSVDNTVIGAATPAAGTFTDLTGRNSLILEDPAAGTNAVTVRAPDNLGADYSLRLPGDDGENGQVLATDGNGALSWTNMSNTTGDVTGVTAGSGLTGGGTAGDVSLSAVLGSTVESSEITDGTLTDADISASAGISFAKLSGVAPASHGHTAAEVGAAPASHTHSASELVGGVIDNALLDPAVSRIGNTIESSEITDGAVTGSDIADNAVTGAHIALSSQAQGDLMVYDGADWVRLPPGNAGELLRSGGAGASPTWSAQSASAINLEFYDANIPTGNANTTAFCTTYNNTGTASGRLGIPRYVSMDGFSAIRIIARSAIASGQGQHTIRIQDMTAGGAGTTLVSINSGWTTSCAVQTATASVNLSGVRYLECQEFSSNANNDPAYSHCAIELIP